MNIMIDYDGTFSADPKAWQDAIKVLTSYGHRMFLVTSRGDDTPVEHAHWFAEQKIIIVYCNYRAKKTVCEEQGIGIHIWIDDDPYYINHGFVDG